LPLPVSLFAGQPTIFGETVILFFPSPRDPEPLL